MGIAAALLLLAAQDVPLPPPGFGEPRMPPSLIIFFTPESDRPTADSAIVLERFEREARAFDLLVPVICHAPDVRAIDVRRLRYLERRFKRLQPRTMEQSEDFCRSAGPRTIADGSRFVGIGLELVANLETIN